jgi:hypothetical protein
VPRDLNSMAGDIAAKIGDLEAEKLACRTRADRRPLNQRLHTLRGLLDWCKSRRGYEESPVDLGLLEPGEMPNFP